MKRSLKALLLAMVLVAMPAAVFAAGSTSTSSGSSRPASSSSSSGGGGGGSSSSSSSGSSSSVYVAGGPSGSSSSSSVGTTESSSTGTTDSGIIETTNAVVTTESGSTYDAGAAYYDPDTGITIALVAEHTSEHKEVNNPGTTYVTGGEAKRAGLPEAVIEALDKADKGDLSGITGLDTSGRTTLGPTLAARNEAGGAATIYCSAITTENAGKLVVLCYNNWTQQYSYLDPTSVDVENQLVHCQIPTSCTLQIIVVE